MFRFQSVETNCVSADLGRYRSYGILAENREGDGWTQVGLVPDVSCDREFVLGLAERCTRGQLSPLSLVDVIVDSLP